MKKHVYRMVLCFVDHDGLGAQGAKDLIEHTRYPNHIIAPTVMEVEEREVDWDDDHPLNGRETREAAFQELFVPERLRRLMATLLTVRPEGLNPREWVDVLVRSRALKAGDIDAASVETFVRAEEPDEQ